MEPVIIWTGVQSGSDDGKQKDGLKDSLFVAVLEADRRTVAERARQQALSSSSPRPWCSARM